MIASLVAAGMIGGLAVVLAELIKQQQVAQKNTETYFEVNSLFRLIVRTLYDGDACTETLQVNGGEIIDQRSIDAIRNKDGGEVLRVNQTYGNGLLRLESMTLGNPNIDTSNNGAFGEVALTVVIKKLGRAVKGYDRVSKSLPLSVEVVPGSPNNVLVKCHHATDNITQIVKDIMTERAKTLADSKVETARDQLCTQLGGTYNATAKTCTLPPNEVSPIVPSSQADTIPSTYSLNVDGHISMFAADTPGSNPHGGRLCDAQRDNNLLNTGSCPSRTGVTWSRVEYHTNAACFTTTGAHLGQNATSTSSCNNAEVAARELVDPNELARTPSNMAPLGETQGRVECSSCYIISRSRYTVRCRFLPRGHVRECYP